MPEPHSIRRPIQFSLRTLLGIVTLLPILSVWSLPELVRRLNESSRGNDFDQVRPPFSGLIELYDPITGISLRFPGDISVVSMELTETE